MVTIKEKITEKIKKESKTGLSLSQRVVQTLSRTGVSSGEVREIVETVRLINRYGLYEDQVPEGKEYIYRELARDGVIKKSQKGGVTYYSSTHSE